MEERQQRLDLSADRVLQEIAKIAFFDHRKLFNQDGSLKNINELDADAAISGFEIASFPKMPGKSRLRSS
jgi:phage terminase small subunit